MKSFIWNGVKKGLEYTIAGLTCWGSMIAVIGILFGLFKAVTGLFGLFSKKDGDVTGEILDETENLGPIPAPVSNEAVA